MSARTQAYNPFLFFLVTKGKPIEPRDVCYARFHKDAFPPITQFFFLQSFRSIYSDWQSTYRDEYYLSILMEPATISSQTYSLHVGFFQKYAFRMFKNISFGLILENYHSQSRTFLLKLFHVSITKQRIKIMFRDFIFNVSRCTTNLSFHIQGKNSIAQFSSDWFGILTAAS